MNVRIANVYAPISCDLIRDDIFVAAKDILSVADERSNVETVVANLRRSLAGRFPDRRFGISFHTYSDREVPIENDARASSLVDVSVDDVYGWLEPTTGRETADLPDDIPSILKKYRLVSSSYVGTVSWTNGFYRSDDHAGLLEFETTIFPALVDRHLEELIAIAKDGATVEVAIDAAFLLGYATKFELAAIETLFALLSSPDHAVHNMAARSLFPKAVARRCEFVLRAAFLLDHQCSYCVNKYIGTVRVLEWTKTEQAFLR